MGTSINSGSRRETAAVGKSAPDLPAVHEKPATPGLLSIKLKLPQGSGEADAEAGEAAAPRSPSAHSRRKGKRSATETRGQKRAIDGRDGPGLGATSSPKRQKESPQPDSPRGSASGRQLLKAPRPVTDLKAMVRLSPRRTESASPPVSPRGPAATGQNDTGSPRRASEARAASGSTATSASTTAPRWRSASYGDMPDGPALSSPRLSPRIGSMAGALALDQDLPAPRPDQAPPASATRATSDAEEISEFAFSGCEYGEDRKLTSAQKDAQAPRAKAADSSAQRSAPDTLTATMLTAEILPTAQAQKDAAAAYLRTLDNALSKPATGKTPAKSQLSGDAQESIDAAPRHAFEAGQTRLETAVMVAEMALSQGDWGDASGSLKDILGALTSCRTSFMALAGSRYGRQAMHCPVRREQ
ncbi:MAG: hypothetical protein ABWY05_12035 [Noviherbaspirillum sp.]